MRSVTIFDEDNPWQNVHLINDIGVIPYLLHKKYGYEAVLAGLNPDPANIREGLYGTEYRGMLLEYYPNYAYVDGVSMEFVNRWDAEAKKEYVRKNAKDTDLLILCGPYPYNLALPEIYKQINPDGKVYVGLDMNSSWYSRLDFTHTSLRNFMDNSDVIATSCTYLADKITRETQWKIHCITNGSYLFGLGSFEKPDWDERDNKIITVGRIGALQKRHDILLQAFALIALYLPSWKIEFIGAVDPAFRPVVDEFYRTFPALKDRVIFSGEITDRDMLWQKYASAKIFALSSDFEGGVPNAAADALNAGCVTCTTRIDAADDLIHYGACGMASDCGDAVAFAANLSALCRSRDLREMSGDAYDWGREFFDMEKNVDRLVSLLDEKKVSFDADSRDSQLFISLADSYAKKNKRQELICLYQALFYAKDEEQQKYIQKRIDSLKDEGVTAPKTSFIILSYNTLDFTRQCLISIRNTVPSDRCQIVVVDNASSDGSVEYLRTLDWITLVENHENRGFPGGCNDGIAVADKENDIYLLNSDTLMPYNAFFWLKMGLYEDDKVGSTGSLTNYAAASQMVKRDWKSVDEMLDFSAENNVPMRYPYEYRMFLIGFSLLLKRSVLDDIGHLDERFNPGNSEDIDICLRILKSEHLNVLCRNSFVIHFGHRSFEELQKKGTDFGNLLQKNNDKLNAKYGFDVLRSLSVNVNAVRNLKGERTDALRILDTDVGMGATAAIIKNYFVNAEYTGFEKDVDRACYAVPFGRIITDDPRTADCSRLFSEEYFDYIIAGQSFEESQPSDVTSRFDAYLKKGGRICLPDGVVLKKDALNDSPEAAYREKIESRKNRPSESAADNGRKHIVFLLYKAASWDSYASIWKICQTDRQMDAVVIPLPYYDKQLDGNPGEFHYEGDLLPDDVPVTWYADLDMSRIRPDAVFINYDSESDVILPPQYEFSAIRECTETLVHVSDEVLSISYGSHIDDQVARQKELLYTPGIKAADIVCLENHDQERILMEAAPSLTADKFIVTGAPQHDIMLSNDRTMIPDEWKSIIGDRKTLLYSIRSEDAVAAGEGLIQKLESLFSFIRFVSDRVVLIFRPDPYLEDVIEDYHPDIAVRYKDIIARYRSEGWVIYDDGIDKYISLRTADAFYGDVSPDMMLFLSSGKTAVMQDYGIPIPDAGRMTGIPLPNVSFPHGVALQETDRTALIIYLGLLLAGKLPGKEIKVSRAGEKIYGLVKSRIEEKNRG